MLRVDILVRFCSERKRKKSAGEIKRRVEMFEDEVFGLILLRSISHRLIYTFPLTLFTTLMSESGVDATLMLTKGGVLVSVIHFVSCVCIIRSVVYQDPSHISPSKKWPIPDAYKSSP